MKNLRIRFSYFGALISALQLLPNIIWALFPPTENRLDGNVSSIPFIEYGEHILGVGIVILLTFSTNKTAANKIHRNAPAITAYSAIVLYWLCWILYFMRIQPNAVIYAMVILPPVAFFYAGIAGKVWLISVASVLFLGFHLTVALENYPIA